MNKILVSQFALSLLLIAVCSLVHAGDPNPLANVPPDHAKRMEKGLELFKAGVGQVLNTHCVKCHGGKMTKADFDLTSRETLLKGGAEGPAIVLYNHKDSLLYKMINHDEEPYMPEKADKLPADKIKLIADWIDNGAPYDKPLIEKKKTLGAKPNVTDEDRKFWSFQPLQRTEPPAVKEQGWCRTPIDKFILAKLEAKSIRPNNAAEKRKLIRRAHMTLIGLPPAPEEIDAFVADNAPDAYDKLVDKLLASPHFGERWARHWLDLARYAESHGYEQDYDRPSAYHYRDFVIKAFNADLPYDTFVKWQIAGDEIAPDNREALMATGYLAAGTHATQITANQAEKERYDELDDMTANVGTTMLGLTIGCARCHDHKFDPLPVTDYYRMTSTFTTTIRHDMDMDFNPEKTKQDKLDWEKAHAPIVEALQKWERDVLPGRLDQWLQTNPTPPQPKWMIMDFTSFKSEGGATLTPQPDGSLLASGANPEHDKYVFVAQTPLTSLTGIRLDAMAHDSFPHKGPGRAANGNIGLSDFIVTAAPLNGKGEAIRLKLVNPKSTFDQPGYPLAFSIDDNPVTGWAVDPQFGKNHSATFEIENPPQIEGGMVLTFTLSFRLNTQHNIGRPRISISTHAKPFTFDGEEAKHAVTADLSAILNTPADKRTDQQKAKLSELYKKMDPAWRSMQEKIDAHNRVMPKPQLTKVLISTEGLPAVRLHTQGPDFYDKTFFLKRGDLNQKNGEATQSFLQVLMRTPEQEKKWQVAPPAGSRLSYRRTAMANWLTDIEHGAGHLLARVIVNRLWQHHIGRGIVSTPSDFGTQGAAPTHPELLDWLATELIRNGWKLKPIHKLIATSAVYMQSTAFDEARYKVDPDNLLCWRRAPKRYEGEVIRDAMLAVSGRLDKRMFGPGTLDEGHTRRSIYFQIKRSQLIPLMVLFDGPDTLQGLALRSTTTVAPQAMALMNNPHVRACAKSLGERLLPHAQSPDGLPKAVKEGYRMALGREPDQDELAATTSFLNTQVEAYKSAGRNDGMQLAMTDLAQALLSLNEFVFDE